MIKFKDILNENFFEDANLKISNNVYDAYNRGLQLDCSLNCYDESGTLNDGRTIGYIDYSIDKQDKTYRIKMLNVLPEYQHKGIATKLYKELQKLAKLDAATIIDGYLTDNGSKLKKSLKESNEIVNSTNENSSKSLLIKGLKSLANTSHLVTEQVLSNLDNFIQNLDLNKFEKKYGKLKNILGNGVFGVVFGLNNGKILKITFDFVEAPFLYKYCLHGETDGMVDVDSVDKIKFGNSQVYIVVRSPMKTFDLNNENVNQVVSDFKNGDRNKKYKNSTQNKVAFALKSMYQMDPNWRGTHADNLGIQNGKIVLYDGFSKNVRLDDSTIPVVNLSKNFIKESNEEQDEKFGSDIKKMVGIINTALNNKNWNHHTHFEYKENSREIREFIKVNISPYNYNSKIKDSLIKYCNKILQDVSKTEYLPKRYVGENQVYYDIKEIGRWEEIFVEFQNIFKENLDAMDLDLHPELLINESLSIKELKQKIRSIFNDLENTGKFSLIGDGWPVDCCWDTFIILIKELINQIPQIKFEIKDGWIDIGYREPGHTWIETKNFIIDPTAGQFFKGDILKIYDKNSQTAKMYHDKQKRNYEINESKSSIKYLYHGTSIGSALNIQKYGLKTGQAIGDTFNSPIYFSNTEQYAKTYADRKGGSNSVTLRVKRNNAILEDPNTGLKGDYKTSESIPPNEIEVKTKDGFYVPILKYDFIEHKVLQESKTEQENLSDGIWYHCTSKENAIKIMKEGFKFGLNKMFKFEQIYFSRKPLKEYGDYCIEVNFKNIKLIKSKDIPEISINGKPWTNNTSDSEIEQSIQYYLKTNKIDGYWYGLDVSPNVPDICLIYNLNKLNNLPRKKIKLSSD